MIILWLSLVVSFRRPLTPAPNDLNSSIFYPLKVNTLKAQSGYIWKTSKRVLESRFRQMANVGCLVYHLQGDIGRFMIWAFTIWSNQFHLPKMAARALNCYQEMALKKWKTNYLFFRENRTTFSVASGNFPLERPRESCSIYFSTGVSGNVW